MHSIALSKSGLYWLLLRAGERDGGAETAARKEMYREIGVLACDHNMKAR